MSLLINSMLFNFFSNFSLAYLIAISDISIPVTEYPNFPSSYVCFPIPQPMSKTVLFERLRLSIKFVVLLINLSSQLPPGISEFK